MLKESNVENLNPLTSLRFIAAMMIVLYHAKLYAHWHWLERMPGTLVHGVSFFFVLSGFILSHVYTSKKFPGYFRFLRARIARLIPVHYFSLLVLIVFVRADSITFDGPGFFSKWIQLGFNLALMHSIVPFLSYAFSWNSVSWSISTEMFFYLAFPFLLINIKKTWHWKLLGSVLLALLVVVVLRLFNVPRDGGVNEVSLYSAVYANPFVHGFEFCLGMAAWVLWEHFLKRKEMSLLFWSLLEIGISVITLAWLYKGFYVLFPYVPSAALQLIVNQNGSCFLFAVLIAVTASGRGVLGKMLSARALVFGGEISFSIYMLHQILFKFFSGWLPDGKLTPIMYFSALFFIASGSYLMIERPARLFILTRRMPVFVKAGASAG